jgi:flagellar motor switch protein FliN/FliY
MSPSESEDSNASSPRTGTVAQTLSLSDLSAVAGPGGERLMSAAAAANAVNPLHQIKARLTVSVGGAELSVGELLEAREQQVLRLDRTLDQPVDILLEGQVIARGLLVAVDDHFGVRITELPRPLTA